jgi:hypothetical protein
LIYKAPVITILTRIIFHLEAVVDVVEEAKGKNLNKESGTSVGK